MNEADWAEVANDVVGAINEVGMVATLIRNTVTATPTYPITEEDDATEECKIVQLQYKDRDRDGVNIRVGDVMILMSVEGITQAPTVGDKIEILSKRKNVVSVQEIAPAGVVVMWKLQARG